ncbi:MAG TPA: CheR family methyltransferase, partial [Oligoflexia bacterium]|nr:CheR family methyltransferase [Oligoflexia bacterium]
MMLDMMTISDEEFRSIRDLVYKHIGINLTTEKKSLVVGRLQKVIRNRGFSSFSDYYRFLIEDSSGAALDELATRISTNHTFFYREHDHFEFFNTVVLPEMVQCRRASAPRDLRVWSAGCSSGEEPYTLVMLMMEYFGAEYGRWDAGVLGTDISERV